MELREFRFEPATYNESIKIQGNCNAITFYNLSTTDILRVNGLPVPAFNGFASFECNANEIDRTWYQIDFGTSTTGVCLVIKKVFL